MYRPVEPSVSQLSVTRIAIAYPDPDIPSRTSREAVGVAIAVLKKVVEDTDNQKKVENAENNTAFCSTRYTKANIFQISSFSCCFEIVIACYNDFSILFCMTDGRTDGRTDRTNCLTPSAYARGNYFVPNYKEERGAIIN